MTISSNLEAARALQQLESEGAVTETNVDQDQGTTTNISAASGGISGGSSSSVIGGGIGEGGIGEGGIGSGEGGSGSDGPGGIGEGGSSSSSGGINEGNTVSRRHDQPFIISASESKCNDDIDLAAQTLQQTGHEETRLQLEFGECPRHDWDHWCFDVIHPQPQQATNADAEISIDQGPVAPVAPTVAPLMPANPGAPVAPAAPASRRDDQPFIIPATGIHNTFDFCFAATRVRSLLPIVTKFHPHDMVVGPGTVRSMVTGFSPEGQALDTLEYNVQHAVEKCDQARMAVGLTELFRHFASLNRPMTRFASPHLDRCTQLELRFVIGPFSNPVSFGLHQRLLTLLLGIAVRQIGIAAPTMTSYVMQEWKRYECVLFSLPALALARLIGIGATLCHCKKNASVSYIRHIFEDTSEMRRWRNQLLSNTDILSTFMSEDQATRARQMLLCSKIYFKPHPTAERDHLRKYQKICLATPHPQYMYQGGPMQRGNLIKLVDFLKQDIPEDVGPSALSVIQDVEDVMMYLASHLNNMYDRDAFDDLQVDYQVFLYLFQRILRQGGPGPGTLLQDSESMILSAPNQITEAYGMQLYAVVFDKTDYIKYGVLVLRDKTPIKSGRGIKRSLEINDFFPTFRPLMISKIHERTPPSIQRDHNDMITEWDDERQRHHAVQHFHFLFELYRVHQMWPTVTRLMADRHSEVVVLDQDFWDLTQPHRVLYKCTATGVAAAEVHLHGSAALDDLLRTREIYLKDVVQAERIRGRDVETWMKQLCQQEGGQKSLKAVLVGPFPLHELPRLEGEIAEYQQVKKALDVQPDLVFVKKIMYTGSAFESGGNMQGLEMGKTYSWVAYVPSLCIENTHVTMTLGELKAIVGQDEALRVMARPILRAAAVMERTCGEFSSWNIDDNYVSFDAQLQGGEIVLKNAYLHAIADTLLGSYPDHRTTMPADNRTTVQDIEAIVDKIREISDIDVDTELYKCESLIINGGKAAVLRPEIGVPVLDLNDNLILGALTVYGQFVHAIGNNLNNNSNSLNIKAEAVNGLHTFIRENLVEAENRDSFCFLNAELIPGECTKRLSNHKIWWKVDGAFKKIDWTKLLIPHSGAIHKKHRTMKSVLNDLNAHGLYPPNPNHL